eukprot:4472550-Amphidinium_carterae.8
MIARATVRRHYGMMVSALAIVHNPLKATATVASAPDQSIGGETRGDKIAQSCVAVFDVWWSAIDMRR